MHDCTFKLISRKETLIGTVTVPLHWAYMLVGRDRPDTAWPAVEFTYLPEEARSPWFYLRDGAEAITYQRCALVYRRWTKFGPAVELRGITPEQFETIEGCTFAPSAAYIRSLLSGE